MTNPNRALFSLRNRVVAAWSLALLATSIPASGSPQEEPATAAPEPILTRQLPDLPGPAVRIETFRTGEGPDAASCTWRRVRSSRDVWQLHRTLEAPSADVAWHQVETICARGHRSVYREVRARAARTVRAEWSEGEGDVEPGTVTVHSHGEGEPLQFELTPGPRAITRLALLELARIEPDRAEGSFQMLEPSTGRFELVETTWLKLPSRAGSSPGLRVLLIQELGLPGKIGRSRGFAAWVGPQLLAFRDGAGGPIFRRFSGAPESALPAPLRVSSAILGAAVVSVR